MITKQKPEERGIRQALYVIIFESDTRGGAAFDVALIIAILASVGVVMIDSIPTISPELNELLYLAEWGFTALFTVEYALRLWVVRRPGRYALSFFGLVDLFAILPTYMALILPGAQYLLAIRILRVIRVFRILKLAHFVGEGQMLSRAMVASRHKIGVFLVAVLTSVTVMGSLLYVVEGEAAGFDSIPRSIYWAIVTITTVGYGDIAPQTPLGQALAACIMLLGYGMIAVPTGIMTVELGNAAREATAQVCGSCGAREPDREARFCRRCDSGLTARAASSPAP
ncbi:MAG: ion transporter [Gemmatimonadetes bacterium]|nr:ion transporter [Gemmatimonadota bacterium]